MKKIVLTISVLLLLGTGCIMGSSSKSIEEINAATEGLDLKIGSTITLTQTVLGVGGKVVDFFGGESAERKLTLVDWQTGQHVKLAWFMQIPVETAASIAEQSAYDARYARVPIGEKIPPKPVKTFETKTREGSIATSGLAKSHAILLPVTWHEGDEGTKQDNSLIWISTEQYDELTQTKKTVLNLGLFDDSLSFALGISDSIHNLVNTLQKDAQKVQDKEDLLSVHAEPDWGTFTLVVDGKETTVQTIQASNWFGRYTILASRDNPLILEVVLSPASKGSLNIFSREKFLNAFAGYKVTKINMPAS